MYDEYVLIDYIGPSNRKGQPVGHPFKVLKQYMRIFKDKNFKIAVPFNYTNYLNCEADLPLNYFIVPDGKNKTINFFKKILNLIKIFSKYKKKNLIFLYVESSLYFILLFLHTSCEITVISYIYESRKRGLKSWLKNILYSFSKRKVSKFLVSSKENLKYYPRYKSYYVPDYFYFEDENKYISPSDRKYSFVILGVISKKKNVEMVLNFFKNRKDELLIKGNFMDKEYYAYLKSKYRTYPNIKIVDKYMSEEEYKDTIANSKWLILPYDKAIYKDRTSGIVVEALFNMVPVITSNISYMKDVSSLGIGVTYKNTIDEVDIENINSKYSTFLENISKQLQYYKINRYKEKIFQ